MGVHTRIFIYYFIIYFKLTKIEYPHGQSVDFHFLMIALNAAKDSKLVKLFGTTQPANIDHKDVPHQLLLKIQFDHPGHILKWRPRDILIWRSRDVPGRLIWDVPRTFSGRTLEDLQPRLWDDVRWSFGCLKISFSLFFVTYSIDQIYLKAIQYSRYI